MQENIIDDKKTEGGAIRDFKGIWIPKEIWFDTKLNALDKMILMEVNSLDNKKGCYGSNSYLATFCNCSVTKVSYSISHLIELRYLKLVYFNGRTRILHSSLTKNFDDSSEKDEGKTKGSLTNFGRQPNENCKTALQKSSAINNNKNTNINTNINIKKKDPMLFKTKIKKSDILLAKNRELINKYFSDEKNEEVKGLLYQYLLAMNEISKLPNSKGFEYSLQDLLEMNKQQQIDSVKLSLKSGYKTFYAPKLNKTNDKYYSRDGIRKEPLSETEQIIQQEVLKEENRKKGFVCNDETMHTKY